MYGKSFESMFEGSMVGAGLHVFAVWSYIITKAKRGFIEINPKLLAFTLGGTEEEIQTALNFLQQPDPNSRSKLEEGRRLVKDGQFQYRIVNWEYYDQIRNEIERRDYNRIRKQQYRALGAQPQPPTPPPSDNPPVPPPAKSPKSNADTVERMRLQQAAETIYDAYPRKVGKGPAVRAIIKALTKIEPAELLKRTIAYAAARNGEDPQFTPHPATWFNQERFNDDPATWKPQPNRNAGSGKPNPRNFGIVGETSYEGAVPRLQRELEEKKRLAQQVDSPAGNASAGNGGQAGGV